VMETPGWQWPVCSGKYREEIGFIVGLVPLQNTLVRFFSNFSVLSYLSKISRKTTAH